MKLRFTWFIPAIIWLIITTILLVMPGSDIPSVSFLDVIYFDKWVHAGLFGMMTIVFYYPFMRGLKNPKKLLIYIAIASALYGVAMEYVQKYFAIDRDFDYYDMIADATGCVIACLLLIYFDKKIKGKILKKNKPL